MNRRERALRATLEAERQRADRWQARACLAEAELRRVTADWPLYTPPTRPVPWVEPAQLSG